MGRFSHCSPCRSTQLPTGQVVYACQSFLVIEVDQQPQIGQDVFDMGALEERGTSHDGVWNAPLDLHVAGEEISAAAACFRQWGATTVQVHDLPKLRLVL